MPQPTHAANPTSPVPVRSAPRTAAVRLPDHLNDAGPCALDT